MKYLLIILKQRSNVHGHVQFLKSIASLELMTVAYCSQSLNTPRQIKPIHISVAGPLTLQQAGLLLAFSDILALYSAHGTIAVDSVIRGHYMHATAYSIIYQQSIFVLRDMMSDTGS